MGISPPSARLRAHTHNQAGPTVFLTLMRARAHALTPRAVAPLTLTHNQDPLRARAPHTARAAAAAATAPPPPQSVKSVVRLHTSSLPFECQRCACTRPIARKILFSLPTPRPVVSSLARAQGRRMFYFFTLELKSRY